MKIKLRAKILADLKIDKNHIWKVLSTVKDPEIPVLSVIEMGIIRDVELSEDGKLKVIVTPTYSGCPAIQAIEEDIAKALRQSGIEDFELKTRLNPAWTTDWMGEEAHRKLREFGIAPPERKTFDSVKSLLGDGDDNTTCPYCGATDTRMTSPFGSTACKSMHVCNSCRQPFEHFKCH